MTSNTSSTSADAATTLVIFGATGDLAMRLLYPGLFRLEQHGHLDGVKLVGTGLEDWSLDQFIAHIETAIAGSGDAWAKRFLGRWSYVPGDLTADAVALLGPHMSLTNVHYLALPPGMFPKAADAIAESGITTAGTHRLVIEKPFGISGQSAAALEDALHAHWDEAQIFRIDHFLGKETVQNLTVTRFANRVFEPLLCAAHVDQVQITVGETLGVEGRYRYYDGIGALRDMIQNHLIQLFCLAAMEPPAVWDPNILRDQKVAVLRSVRNADAAVETWAARGQYGPGTLEGKPVAGYLDEPGIPADSKQKPSLPSASTSITGGGRAFRSTCVPGNDSDRKSPRSPTGSGSRQHNFSDKPLRRSNRTGWSFASTSPKASTCSSKPRPSGWRSKPTPAISTPTTAQRSRRSRRTSNYCST